MDENSTCLSPIIKSLLWCKKLLKSRYSFFLIHVVYEHFGDLYVHVVQGVFLH